ncbi:transporter [Chitinasiproducens palmae]|uniref:Zinc transporter n=1 Tax=Chitinasiproducens palmae TaxID=1770053 RepID=A0A1H2PK38_9BURK|nr:transporter [Chitinasiproducens palmae]SDV46732.1 zinc transporter [Chitinasiproducens palmae]
MERDYATLPPEIDVVGLLCAFRFLPDHAGVPLDLPAVLDWLERQGDQQARSEEFVWLHFNLAHAASENWLRSHLELPDGFFELLREGSHSTRIEQQEGALLAIVNDVTFDLEFSPADVSTLWICARGPVMITARHTPLRSVDSLRAAIRRGETFRSTVELLVYLMRDQADLLVRIVRHTSLEVDLTEDRFVSARESVNRFDLGAMRRILVRLQRMLAPEPGSIFRLLARPPRWLHADDVQDLRESTEEFSLVLGDLAGLVERIRLLQEEVAARLEEQNTRTLFTLTLVTVLALPVNIIAGFFGMNVGGIPFSSNAHGFWLMVVLVASSTAAAGWWIFRRQIGPRRRAAQSFDARDERDERSARRLRDRFWR